MKQNKNSMLRYAWQDYFRRFLSQVRKWVIIERVIEEQIAGKGRVKWFQQKKVLPGMLSLCHLHRAYDTQRRFCLSYRFGKHYQACIPFGIQTGSHSLLYMPFGIYTEKMLSSLRYIRYVYPYTRN